LPGTNTLAYHENKNITDVQRLITLPEGTEGNVAPSSGVIYDGHTCIVQGPML